MAGAFLSIYPAKRAEFFNSTQPSKQLTDVFSGTKNEDELNQQQMKGDRETRWIGRERGREKGKCQAREIRTNANREKRNLHVNEETKWLWQSYYILHYIYGHFSVIEMRCEEWRKPFHAITATTTEQKRSHTKLNAISYSFAWIEFVRHFELLKQ